MIMVASVGRDMDTEVDGTLLVPVANAETAERLLDTALDIATEKSYRLLLTHVVEVPPQVPLSEGEQLLGDDIEAVLADAVETSESAGVPARQLTRYARGVATGILGAVEKHDVDVILAGWRGRPPRRGVVLGSYIDKILREGACDTLVKRIRMPMEGVESILVPVASGPHNEYAAETAGILARRHDARVTLLHVVSEGAADERRTEGRELLSGASEDLGEVRDTALELAENDHVSGEITDRSTRHDLTIVGASQKSVIRQTFLGTVSEAVGRHAGGAVMIAQKEL